MLLALLLLAVPADWVPARWPSSDVKSLELLEATPVNCLLLEQRDWSGEFAAAARRRGAAVLGVIRPGAGALDAPALAGKAALDGVVIEGEFDEAALRSLRGSLDGSPLAVIELPVRSRMRFDGVPVVGTFQGLWPGIHVDAGGAAKAAPTGAPWIDTNYGFLHFVRALTRAPVWIGNLPPPKTVIPVSRYIAAIGDAALAGARWIVALDADFSRRLLDREAAALRDWGRMAGVLRFYEEHKDWRELRPHGRLAIVIDVDSGALASGGIFDMIAARHTPMRPVPARKLDDEAVKGAQIAVNVAPYAIPADRQEALRRFARAGGTLLTSPPDWRSPEWKSGQILFDEKEVAKMEAVFRDVNQLTGRRNLGARLFNVSSMLSSLSATPGGKRVVLQLVNYSGYPVENVTVHLLGRFARAQLFEPGAPGRNLETYLTEEGTGVDVPKLGTVGALVVEAAKQR